MLDIRKCPRCGGIMTIKVSYNLFKGPKSIEECYRCGLMISIDKVQEIEGSKVDLFSEETMDSSGRLVCYNLNENKKPVESRVLHEGDYEDLLDEAIFLENTPYVNKDLSFISWWNKEEEKLECLFGTLPPLYEDSIKEIKERIASGTGFKYTDIFFNSSFVEVEEDIPF